jgi:hypothetical protein
LSAFVAKVARFGRRFAFFCRDQKLVVFPGTQMQASPSLAGDLARQRELEISVVQSVVYFVDDTTERQIDDRPRQGYPSSSS